MTKDTSPSLRDLVAAPVDVPVGGITIKIQPLGWYESIDAIDAIAPALSGMPNPPSSGGEVDMLAWVAWLKDNRDPVVRFCVLAAHQDQADVQALPPSPLLELLFGILELNADFFIASLPAAISRISGRVGGLELRIRDVMKQLPSSMSGSSSSSVATASAT